MNEWIVTDIISINVIIIKIVIIIIIIIVAVTDIILIITVIIILIIIIFIIIIKTYTGLSEHLPISLGRLHDITAEPPFLSSVPEFCFHISKAYYNNSV